MSNHPIAPKVLELTQKIGQELTFTEAGKDTGLLPLNSFITEMEDLLTTADLPSPIPAAIRHARKWIDNILDTTAQFDAGTLMRLAEWTSWLEIALEQLQSGHALPVLPVAWSEAGVPVITVGTQVAGLAQNIAKELATAEVGKDIGLLPINSFIYEIEDLLSKADFPSAVDEAVHYAREWINHILDTSAVFDDLTLERLTDWATWMDAAMEQSEQGNGLPTLPSSWTADSASAPESLSAVGPRIVSLVQQLGLELAFAESGKDNGLLPINSFVCQVEELAKTADLPSEILVAIAYCREWLDHVFDTSAKFDEPTLARLGEWTSWMETALDRASQSTAIPVYPGTWTSSESAPAPTAPAPAKPEPAPATPPPAAAPAVTAPAPPPMSEPLGEEPVLEMNLDGDDRDLIVGFVSESYEHLQNIEQGVLVLEENPTDAGTLNSIFRAFHTFKGGAGCCNLTCIKDLAHELESVLDAARQHKLEINKDIIDVILEGGDTLSKFVAQIADRLAGKDLAVPILIPTLHLIARAKHILGHGPAPGAPSAPAPAVAASTASTSPAPAATPSTGASEAPVATPAATAPSAEHAAAKPAAPKPGAAAAPAPAAGFVKVDTYKLDALIDLVGELVISESMVVQDPEIRALPSRNISRNLGQLRRITSELQRTAMSLRMVPIRATFQKMTRLVRDLGTKQNKQVQLVMSGEDTELDRNIVEEISDPLVHMIRNAADHGVEKPEARIAKGKPAMGTINLRAFHQGGNIVIQIQDDGNGLNKEKLLSKARERGLVKPNETLPDKEIYGLIFAAGFSTAEVISDISGRGVGMDVVRQNIEKLRGKVDIDTIPGEGTTFTIYLPLTLAIIDGMIVSVGGERYIIPTLSVRESFRPRAEMISSVHERGEMVNVRGRLSPLLRLYHYLEQEPKVTDPAEAIIVVVESGSQTRCLMVDELLGKQEVVIKSLGGAMKKSNALAGGAVLGDGRVGLILNVDALVKLSGTSSGL
ncbi:MAG: chemotaxis protein CheA [Verrucomicrobiota bacterium]